MEVNDKTLTELLRLTEDNNRMLHKMRRNAFWGGLIKFVLYAFIFVGFPLWIYATYLAPVMDQMLKTYQEIQGTGVKAQAQFGDFQHMLDQLKEKFSPQQ